MKYTSRTNGFSVAMRLVLVFLFGAFTVRTFAQEKEIEGIVFDKDTKERVARTLIIDTTTRKAFYNNLKGEFKIEARIGDVLIFNKEDYFSDTLTVKSGDNLLIYLHRKAIPLKGVTIKDSLHTPLQKLAATKREYSMIYGSRAYNDPLSAVPGGGAGINLDALYNALSRKGRDAIRLQGVIQQDYEENVIDYRFNKSYVANITHLKDPDLTDFMHRYRPSYFRVTTDTEYEFITYIKTSLRRYLRLKRSYTHSTATKSAGP
ncbi:MAG TPA: hypothetical protein VHB54_21945 [Mucilaginibacter sp.]|nr:hypothetical protein [Mucilaginibacter sp.]